MGLFHYWWALAMISGAGLAARNLLFKSANTKMDPALAALVLSCAMAAVSLLYYCIQRKVTGLPYFPEAPNWNAIWMASFAGAGVAFANIVLALAYKAGGHASLTALLQNGFALTVTIVLGALLLGEVIRPMQFCGIFLVFAGIILITRG